jgi:hypothetical protein
MRQRARQRPTARSCTRGFERSRLEQQFWMMAYELVLPVVRRPVSASPAPGQVPGPRAGQGPDRCQRACGGC